MWLLGMAFFFLIGIIGLRLQILGTQTSDTVVLLQHLLGGEINYKNAKSTIQLKGFLKIY